MIPQKTLQVSQPVEQGTPQESALDQYLAEEVGSVMMEGYGPEDELPFGPVAELDPTMMLASFNPKKGADAAAQVAELLTRKKAAGTADEAAEMPNLNPFAESVDNPDVMGDNVLPSQEAVLQSVQQQPDTTALAGRQAPSNINLDHFNDPADKQLIDLVAKANDGYAYLPERKVKTHKETLEEAKSRRTLESVLNKRASDKWSTGELVSIYKIMEAQSKNLTDLGKRITEIKDSGGEPDGELLAQFHTATQRFRAAQATASGVASEAGRLLNAMQAISKAGNSNEYYRQVANAIEGGGGRDTIIERARMFSNDPDLKDANKIVALTFSEKAWKGAMQVRYNMMLSSARTHAANITGATVTGAIESFPRKAAASAWSWGEYVARKVIPGLTPMDQKDRIDFFSEMPAEIAGIRQGTIEGIKLASKIARGEADPQIISGSKWFDEMGLRYDPAGMENGMVSKLATTPTRLLEAEDAFFKNVYFNQHIHTLASRRTRGLDNAEEAYSNLVQFPTEDMVQAARAYSEKLTLTSNPNVYSALLGDIAQAVGNGTNQSKLLKILVPFTKTPANALGYALEMNFVGGKNLFSEQTLKVMRGEVTPAERAEYMGTVMTSAGMWAVLAQYFEEGKITGSGPENAGVRRAWEKTGWQPNSILVGGKYYPLNRTDPLGMSILMMATGMEATISDQNKDAFGTGAATVLSVAEIMQNRSMLSGFADFLEVIDSGSDRAAATLISSTGASFLAAGAGRDVREMADPYRRELAFDNNTFMEGTATRFEKYIRNAYPVLSESVPPSVDVNGDLIMNDGSKLWRGLVPIRLTKVEEQDPVAAMYMLNNTPVSKPSYVFRISGTPVSINTLQLDDQAGWLYHDYQVEVGKARHELMTQFMASPDWKRAAADGMYGEGSPVADKISGLMAKGMQLGQSRFLEKIAGATEYQPMVNGEKVGDPIEISLPYEKEMVMEVAKSLKKSAFQGEVDQAYVDSVLETDVLEVPEVDQIESLPSAQKTLIQDSVGDVEF